MLKRLEYKIFITVFLLIAIHASPEGPQNIRFTNTLESLVGYGTFALQTGYRQHIDTIRIGEELYSSIPPGVPILLSPLYWIYRTIAHAFGLFSPSSDVYWAVFSILTIVCVMAPLVSFTSIILFRILGKLTNNNFKKILLTLTAIFGSLIFVYSTYGIWSHVYAMSFLLIAFYLTLERKNTFLIGLCLGIVQLINYESVLPIFLLLGFWIYLNRKDLLSTDLRSFKKLGLLLLVYSIFLFVLMSYNHSITGSYFTTPTSLIAKELILKSQFYDGNMFNFPSIQTIWGLTFSPYRGIFLYVPMTFLLIPSCFSAFKRSRKNSSIVIFSYIFCAAIFCFNLIWLDWWGGICFGPRHLVIALPFMLIPAVYCSTKLIQIFSALSVFVGVAGVATDPGNNIFVNIAVFLYRGPSLRWLDYLYKVILPEYWHIHLDVVTPFFIYVGLVYLIYLVWRQGPRSPTEHNLIH